MVTDVLNKANELRPNKLSLKTKISYGIGQMTDSISANIFVFFFVFFLTNIAGINPGTAGTIALIATGWDAISDPIVGYLSDNINTKYGKRRPFILVASIPIGVAIWLLFTTVNFSGNSKVLYYVIVSMFYYTAYTCYYVPYMALGGELTNDYNERTSVRFFCLGFQLLGLFIASSGTMAVVGKMTILLGSEQAAWSITAGIFGALSSLAAIISWNFTRGKEPIVKKKEKDKVSFWFVFRNAVTIKSIQVLSIAVVLYAMGFSITSGILVFLLNDVIVLAGEQQAMFWLFMSVIGLLIIPISNILGNKLGKRKAYILVIMTVALLQLCFSVISFNFVLVLIFILIVNMGHNTYFGLFQSMMYDCCEVFEYKVGMKKQGAVTSIIFLFAKFGQAIGMWLMGMIMQWTGYIGTVAVQSEGAIKGIKMLATVYAPSFYLLSALTIIIYKLDGQKFKALQNAMIKKANNESHDSAQFNDII